MALSPHFQVDPFAILDPAVRWYPGDDQLGELGLAKLIPPLVHKVRMGVKAWRDGGYAGASDTTRALLHHWFESEHYTTGADGTPARFRWYFAQREAVESAIWLYEVEQAHDPYALLRYDSSGAVGTGSFDEDWPRYVLKLATGAGKTKVMSLLIAWSYFHRKYEAGSSLSTNFLLVAPNIIVLDRLLVDFDGLRIFHDDPILPPNGHGGRDWQDDFQMVLHVQDEIGHVAPTGNLFLTNIHRVHEGGAAPGPDDANTMDYFLGARPVAKTTDSQVDLAAIIRTVPDLVVLNDEAHHIHDPDMAWARSIRDIDLRLRQKDGRLSVQLDLTATPRHNDGGIFVQTVSDYPLVEAIRQRVVKLPVLPDAASRAKLNEKPSDSAPERYEDYLHLGYLEWKAAYAELEKLGRKAILFVMTDDTKSCDAVADHLRRYPDLADAVLVIHTNAKGEISEAKSKASKAELDLLRQQSRTIDSWDSPYKAVVSVMVLREGWDVQNVTSIVGLRPYTAKSQVLPEQTLGRGLRRMFRGRDDLQEKVSIIGTEAFMDFVESIKTQGVELDYQPMGGGAAPKSPIVIEVERDNPAKDIERLDIELPILAPRVVRHYKNLDDLDIAGLKHRRVPVRQFSAEQQREIVLRDIDREEQSHVTVMDGTFAANHQTMIGFFARAIQRDLRLVGGFDTLFAKVKAFVESHLFDRPVDLDDLNVLRNLSEQTAIKTLLETLKGAINDLTIHDSGDTRLVENIKISRARPYPVNQQAYYQPRKSAFNKVVGDSGMELEFAAFLDNADDVQAFFRNDRSMQPGFRIEYANAAGGIANYYPDFVVRLAGGDIWVVETKGVEDLDVAPKWERLKTWCEDATREDGRRVFRPLLVRYEEWERYRPRSFAEATTLYEQGDA